MVSARTTSAYKISGQLCQILTKINVDSCWSLLQVVPGLLFLALRFVQQVLLCETHLFTTVVFALLFPFFLSTKDIFLKMTNTVPLSYLLPPVDSGAPTWLHAYNQVLSCRTLYFMKIYVFSILHRIHSHLSYRICILPSPYMPLVKTTDYPQRVHV